MKPDLENYVKMTAASGFISSMILFGVFSNREDNVKEEPVNYASSNLLVDQVDLPKIPIEEILASEEFKTPQEIYVKLFQAQAPISSFEYELEEGIAVVIEEEKRVKQEEEHRLAQEYQRAAEEEAKLAAQKKALIPHSTPQVVQKAGRAATQSAKPTGSVPTSCPEPISSALGWAGCAISYCESGWDQNEKGLAEEKGWFQIHPVHKDSTYDPAGNIAATLRISNGGTNWSAWTTRSVLQTGICPNGKGAVPA